MCFGRLVRVRAERQGVVAVCVSRCGVKPMCVLQIVPTVEVKVCKKCADEKPSSDFPRNKLTNDGLHSYCKSAHITPPASSSGVHIPGNAIRRRLILTSC